MVGGGSLHVHIIILHASVSGLAASVCSYVPFGIGGIIAIDPPPCPPLLYTGGGGGAVTPFAPQFFHSPPANFTAA